MNHIKISLPIYATIKNVNPREEEYEHILLSHE